MHEEMTHNPKMDQIFRFCIDKMSVGTDWSLALISKLAKDKVYMIGKSNQGNIGLIIMPSGIIIHAVSYIYQEIHVLIEFNLYQEISLFIDRKS